jgi:hypothetical protein
VAAGTADMRFASRFAESVRRVEGEIAQIGHVGLMTAGRLRVKDFARIIGRILIELRADGHTATGIVDRGGVRVSADSQPDHCGGGKYRPRAANSCYQDAALVD